MKNSLEQANEDIEVIIRQTEEIKKGKYFGVIDFKPEIVTAIEHRKLPLYGPYHGSNQSYIKIRKV